MTLETWNQLQRGDMLRTTKKLMAVGDVRPNRSGGANELRLHWVTTEPNGTQVVTVHSYNSADPGPYEQAGQLRKGALLSDGQFFDGGTVDKAAGSRLGRALRAAWSAFRTEWCRA